MSRGRLHRSLATTTATRGWTILLVLAAIAVLAAGCGSTSASNGTAPTAVTVTVDSDLGHAPARQGETEDQARLRTVGGTAPSLTGKTEQDLRSQSGSLLAAADSAWNQLTRSERAILLDGDVAWLPYDEAVAGDPELAEALAPAVVAAGDLSPEGIILAGDVDINEVVLDLPRPELAEALTGGEPQAVAVGSDVIILFDNVVVAGVSAAADLVPGLSPGVINEQGLIVAPGAAAARPQPAPTVPSAPTVAPVGDEPVPKETDRAEPPLKVSANGDEIPRVDLASLPPEAEETMFLILIGGPFPFERDGATFGNFEERLPAAGHGYYREYTVITPGASNRGARRIVAGNHDTEFFYTDDHYESFVEVFVPDDWADRR